MDARNLRPALPELRAITDGRYLEEPDFFLDQLRPVGLLQRPEEAPNAAAWSFSSNKGFWEAVLREQVRASRPVALTGFYLSEWIPRSPGLFHTYGAANSREYAMQQVFEEPYAQELAWIDHADVHEFERGVYGREAARGYLRIFNPHGKIQMLRGGVGCIRLRRHGIEGRPVWLMSASSTLTAHEGVPLAVPHDRYTEVIDSLTSDGIVYCSSITGTLRYVPDFLGNLYQWPDVPPVYLDVEDIRPGPRPDETTLQHAMVSVAVSFEARSEQPGPPGMLWATYVTFFPGVEGSLQLRRDWLRDNYVRKRYQGRVISDFDEQVPRFEGAPFGLIRVFDGSLNLDEIPRPVGQDPTVREAFGRCRDIRRDVIGDGEESTG